MLEILEDDWDGGFIEVAVGASRSSPPFLRDESSTSSSRSSALISLGAGAGIVSLASLAETPSLAPAPFLGLLQLAIAVPSFTTPAAATPTIGAVSPSLVMVAHQIFST